MSSTLCIKDVYHRGENGQFRANAEMIGWKGSNGGDPVIHACGDVKRAEWLQGQLRVLCEDEDGNDEVMKLEGFANEDFDKLWRHFESYCSVYIKKHKPMAELNEADFDHAMHVMESAADKVDDAPEGSVQKKGREFDLLKQVEGVRNGLEEAVKGDKQALNRVFTANGCERIGRVRLVLDTVTLEVYGKDDRWLHLRNAAKTVESVLRDLGTFRRWKPSEQDGNASMIRRQLVWEMKRRQGLDCEEEDGQESEEQEQQEQSNVSNLRHLLADKMPVLPGPLHQAPLQKDPLQSAGYPDLAAGNNLMPTPPPPPPPAEESEDSDADREAGPPSSNSLVAERGDDSLSRYEDAEVTNPNTTPAAPPGYENSMGLGRTGESRRMHYTRNDSLLEGWVWKRSRVLRKWRRRWLVLTKDGLESFKHRGGLKPTESMESGTVQTVYSADGEVSMAKCFCVVSVNRGELFGVSRSFYMVCDDDAQKAEWIKQVAAVQTGRR